MVYNPKPEEKRKSALANITLLSLQLLDRRRSLSWNLLPLFPCEVNEHSRVCLWL